MDFVRGESLGSLAASMSSERLNEVLGRLLQALKELEDSEHNIVHRDLHENNVLVDEADVLYIIDFGDSSFIDTEGNAIRVGTKSRVDSAESAVSELRHLLNQHPTKRRRGQ